MAKTRTTRYDVAEHLRTDEEMAAYLEACIEEADGDASFVAKALGDIARARGMAQIARDTGLSRESLYKALSGERSPELATVLKVSKALGMGWSVYRIAAPEQQARYPSNRRYISNATLAGSGGASAMRPMTGGARGAAKNVSRTTRKAKDK